MIGSEIVANGSEINENGTCKTRGQYLVLFCSEFGLHTAEYPYIA